MLYNKVLKTPKNLRAAQYRIKKGAVGMAANKIKLTICGANYVVMSEESEEYIQELAARLDEDMKPYLLQLKKNFTSYELIFTLRFRCKYSTRLFELVSSIHYRTLEEYSRIYTIDELRRMMGAENYKTWQAFKERALNPAVKEINQYSNKNVAYNIIKQVRSVVGVELIVSSKDTMEAIRIRGEIEKEFGYDQMTFWDELKGYGYVND